MVLQEVYSKMQSLIKDKREKNFVGPSLTDLLLTTKWRYVDAIEKSFKDFSSLEKYDMELSEMTPIILEKIKDYTDILFNDIFDIVFHDKSK